MLTWYRVSPPRHAYTEYGLSSRFHRLVTLEATERLCLQWGTPLQDETRMWARAGAKGLTILLLRHNP